MEYYREREVVVHSSQSSWGSVDAIEEWHRRRGWHGNRYHFVITNGRPEPSSAYAPEFDGRLFRVQPLSEPGSVIKPGVWGRIEVCMIGNHLRDYVADPSLVFTEKQLQSLYDLLQDLRTKFPGISIKGDSDIRTETRPFCPGFDVQDFFFNKTVNRGNYAGI